MPVTGQTPLGRRTQFWPVTVTSGAFYSLQWPYAQLEVLLRFALFGMHLFDQGKDTLFLKLLGQLPQVRGERCIG